VAETTVLPLKNYQNGVYDFGPVDVPDAVTRVEYKIARCTTATPTIWPNATTTLTINMEYSLDGGATWWGVGGGVDGATGGIQMDKYGTSERTYEMGFGTIPSGAGRLIRGRVIIAGGPLRTSVGVVVN
jgi:hypothetical protein